MLFLVEQFGIDKLLNAQMSLPGPPLMPANHTGEKDQAMERGLNAGDEYIEIAVATALVSTQTDPEAMVSEFFKSNDQQQFTAMEALASVRNGECEGEPIIL